MMKTSKPAIKIGRALARKYFSGRGNNSEVHLAEVELAALLSIAAEIGKAEYVEERAFSGSVYGVDGERDGTE